MMQEEISLREIIETLWKGKVMIAAVTLAAVLVAAVISWFVLDPTYEVSAYVRVDESSADNKNLNLNSIAQTATSDISLNRVIMKLELDPNQYSISSLKNSIKTEVPQGTNVMRVKVTGTNPDDITRIANLLAMEIAMRSEITDRSGKIVKYNQRLEELENLIALVQSEIKETEAQLASTPETLVTRKTVADDPYLQSIINEEQGNARQNGALELVTEEVNPVYTTLKGRLADKQIELSKLQSEQQSLKDHIDKHQSEIAALEDQILNDRLYSTSSQRFLGGESPVFVSSAIVPTVPVGPNKVLNVAIAFVIGLMIGVMAVFIRHYWKTSAAAPNVMSANVR